MAVSQWEVETSISDISGDDGPLDQPQTQHSSMADLVQAEAG